VLKIAKQLHILGRHTLGRQYNNLVEYNKRARRLDHINTRVAFSPILHVDVAPCTWVVEWVGNCKSLQS
jgi:hypothetical protein